MNSLRIIFIILISFTISKSAYAKNPSDLIKEIVDQASDVLSSDDPVESKIIKLNDIAERSVDINGIGMYTLGKYRKSISEEDKSKYQKLFKSYFLKSFSSRLVDYTDPKINVVSEKKVSDKYTIVNSILEASKGRPEVKIDWRIYTKNPEKPLIRDLMVEGLSLARTQKEEFNSVIQNNNGDINSLFRVLEEFIIK
ncbi:MlaC/ttg2D family ABC transporter substrate-binding protein [Candidatus Pelagibacter communis]|uniref:MlaC/ttg2D family ABC transporter substrate-binding protein n=1 Tax=Pelagibacter ubique TaxID=198252 RepID=UPI000A5B00FA|nr:ABC transporter substrate-binding protein [Candidatus Pelagibacter ubique]